MEGEKKSTDLYVIKKEIQYIRQEINEIQQNIQDVKNQLQEIKYFIGMEHKKFTNPPSYIY